MAPSYHAHAPAVPLPLALPLLALGPGFEKMFRANISTQHMLETFARLALHDDERHGRRVRRGRAATRDVPPRAPCAVRRLPATFLSLSVLLSCSFSRLVSLCLLELAGAISPASDRRLRRQRRSDGDFDDRLELHARARAAAASPPPPPLPGWATGDAEINR